MFKGYQLAVCQNILRWKPHVLVDMVPAVLLYLLFILFFGYFASIFYVPLCASGNSLEIYSFPNFSPSL